MGIACASGRCGVRGARGRLFWRGGRPLAHGRRRVAVRERRVASRARALQPRARRGVARRGRTRARRGSGGGARPFRARAGLPYATLARAVAAFGKRLADVAGAPRGGGGAIDNEWASATAQLVRDIAHAVERLLLDGYPLASLGACRATPGAYEGGGGGGGRCGTLFAPTSPDGLALHGVTEQVPPAAVPLLRWAALALLALSRHSPLAAGGCVWDASLYSAVDGVVLAYAPPCCRLAALSARGGGA